MDSYFCHFHFFWYWMQNGMTPLHLAVWHSTRAEEDCSTVQTLLEYNADCSAKDNVVTDTTIIFPLTIHAVNVNILIKL